MRALRSILFLSLMVLLGCKGDNIHLPCCGAVDPSLEQYLFAPNLYTPDGYGPGVDEWFFLIPRSVDTLDHPAITLAYDFKVRKPNGALFHAVDTIYRFDGTRSDVYYWDFVNEQGVKAKGTYDIQFGFVDMQGSHHRASYQICVITCQDVETNLLKLDRTKCRTNEQIDPRRGFVHQHTESSCYFK